MKKIITRLKAVLLNLFGFVAFATTILGAIATTLTINPELGPYLFTGGLLATFGYVVKSQKNNTDNVPVDKN